jgi:hypothetical protein
MNIYFKNEKKSICIENSIHSLKYINIFLILYIKCARKCLHVLLCAANQKRLRTAALMAYREENRCICVSRAVTKVRTETVKRNFGHPVGTLLDKISSQHSQFRSVRYGLHCCQMYESCTQYVNPLDDGVGSASVFTDVSEVHEGTEFMVEVSRVSYGWGRGSRARSGTTATVGRGTLS